MDISLMKHYKLEVTSSSVAAKIYEAFCRLHERIDFRRIIVVKAGTFCEVKEWKLSRDRLNSTRNNKGL